ncbi:hypothetical protein FISHEDRAFT_72800 [Fistulina hepatica ATCC 64428]|nr:hypothetical protein FISHEDRAFT_72800 [Fistulina hepatica ATCC 64428]
MAPVRSQEELCIDRVFAFVGAHVSYALREAHSEIEEADDEDVPTPGSENNKKITLKGMLKHFARDYLDWLEASMRARNANVRLCSTKCVACMAESGFWIIPDEIYEAVLCALLERRVDPQKRIRLVAIAALCALFRDDEKELKKAKISQLDDRIVNGLLSSLSDPEWSIRLFVVERILPIPDLTVDHLLQRARDENDRVRCAVYKMFREHAKGNGTDVGRLAPWLLSRQQRLEIARLGLGDRDEKVRNACKELMCTWFHATSPGVKQEDGVKEEACATSLVARAMPDFIELFDLKSPEIVEKIMVTLFEDYKLDRSIRFGEDFWSCPMSLSCAFLARVFAERIKERNDDLLRASSAFPEIPLLSYVLQESYNDVLQKDADYQTLKDQTNVKVEDDFVNMDELPRQRRCDAREARTNARIVARELLQLTGNLDFTDEYGRKQMISLMKTMISNGKLHQELVARAIDVLFITFMAEEKTMVDAIFDLIRQLRIQHAGLGEANRDLVSSPDNDNYSPLFMNDYPNDKDWSQAARLDIHCLDIVTMMHERCNIAHDDGVFLQFTKEFIVPCVGFKPPEKPESEQRLILRSQIMRKGLLCLSFLCLVSEVQMAKRYGRSLFASSFPSWDPEHVLESERILIRQDSLKAVFDMILVFPAILQSNAHCEEFVKAVAGVLFQEQQTIKYRVVACIGLAKLLACGVIQNPKNAQKALRHLLVTYFDPFTDDNETKQALWFFFADYALTRTAREQRNMLESFFGRDGVLRALAGWRAYYKNEADKRVPLPVILMQFLRWTDFRHTLAYKQSRKNCIDRNLHFHLALRIIVTLVENVKAKCFPDDFVEALCSMFQGLYIPDEVDHDELRGICLCCEKLRTYPVRNKAFELLCNFHDSLTDKFVKELEMEDMLNLEQGQQLHEFLDAIRFEEEEDTKPVLRTRKRQASAITTRSDLEDEIDHGLASQALADFSRRKQGMSTYLSFCFTDLIQRRPRLSNNSHDAQARSSVSVKSESSVPVLSIHRRCGTPPPINVEVIYIASDSEDDDEVIEIPPPHPPSSPTPPPECDHKDEKDSDEDDESEVANLICCDSSHI